MWGEFEDEKGKGKTKSQTQISEETVLRPCAENDEVEDNTMEVECTYDMPLKDRLVHHLAASNIIVKSQQRYEPDFTYQERKDIIEELLQKPGQFLYRFGKHMEREHLQYFLKYEGDAEVDHFLAEALKHKNEHTSKITVRNRRYAALQEMRRSGDYFSEQEMERRDPLLYEQLIGQHQTQEEREEKYTADESDKKFSSLLLHHMDSRANKEFKRRQEDQEDDMFEEDTDDDEEEDCDEVIETPVESREKQLFKEEFYSNEYCNFLRGQNKDFNYKEVDNSDAFDLLDIQARDEEERYFDEDEEILS